MAHRVGVLAIQGDFERHIHSLNQLSSVSSCEVRTPEDLARVERLIIPGGESTAVALLLQRFGVGEALQARIAEGMPVWGTCMGLILLAKDIEDRPSQWTLGALDVTVRRNAFGSQVHSFETRLAMAGIDGEIEAVFIRAPVVTRMGPNVEALAHYEGQIVAVRSGGLLGTCFHPELTGDHRVHEWFLGL
jgi:5'-phosphate synthase pdxT subunit